MTIAVGVLSENCVVLAAESGDAGYVDKFAQNVMRAYLDNPTNQLRGTRVTRSDQPGKYSFGRQDRFRSLSRWYSEQAALKCRNPVPDRVRGRMQKKVLDTSGDDYSAFAASTSLNTSSSFHNWLEEDINAPSCDAPVPPEIAALRAF